VTTHSTVSRRTFLTHTSFGGAALALGFQSGGSRMFISQNGAVAPRTAWPDSARLAARIGYGGIDWSLGPAKMAGLDATRALFAELKLQPTVVNLPMTAQVAFGPEEAFKTALGPLADDAAFVAGVGCSRMMLVLSPVSPQPKDERRILVRDRLAMIGEVLGRHKMRLGLEFLGPLCMRAEAGCGPAAGAAAPARGAAPPAAAAATPPPARLPFIWTLPETVALGRDSGPNVGAVLDVWHWHHSGGTVADIVATDPARIVHVHLSDARAMAPEEVRDNMRLMPGEGIVDLTGFLRALQKIGYAGGVAPEPLGRIPMEMAPEEASKLGYETTRAAMMKAGVL
jgi:sugar phosphate isomerase/epimerase